MSTMTVDFREYFWGERNAGFDVLYRNAKQGHWAAAKELVEFVRERGQIEESYSKLLAKLAGSRLLLATGTGSVAPLWAALRSSTERAATLHGQLAHQLADSLRDLQRYADEQHRRAKTLKDEEAVTADAIHTLQHQTALMAKVRRDACEAAAAVVAAGGLTVSSASAAGTSGGGVSGTNGAEASANKIIGSGGAGGVSSTSGPSEAQLKRRRKALEDFRLHSERHENARLIFIRRMNEACARFQVSEENHLSAVKSFIDGYIRTLGQSYTLCGTMCTDLQTTVDSLSIDALLERFCTERGTGRERPQACKPLPPEMIAGVATSGSLNNSGLHHRGHLFSQSFEDIGRVASSFIHGNVSGTSGTGAASTHRSVHSSNSCVNSSSTGSLVQRQGSPSNAGVCSSLDGIAVAGGSGAVGGLTSAAGGHASLLKGGGQTGGPVQQQHHPPVVSRQSSQSTLYEFLGRNLTLRGRHKSAAGAASTVNKTDSQQPTGSEVTASSSAAGVGGATADLIDAFRSSNTITQQQQSPSPLLPTSTSTGHVTRGSSTVVKGALSAASSSINAPAPLIDEEGFSVPPRLALSSKTDSGLKKKKKKAKQSALSKLSLRDSTDVQGCRTRNSAAATAAVGDSISSDSSASIKCHSNTSSSSSSSSEDETAYHKKIVVKIKPISETLGEAKSHSGSTPMLAQPPVARLVSPPPPHSRMTSQLSLSPGERVVNGCKTPPATTALTTLTKAPQAGATVSLWPTPSRATPGVNAGLAATSGIGGSELFDIDQLQLQLQKERSSAMLQSLAGSVTSGSVHCGGSLTAPPAISSRQSSSLVSGAASVSAAASDASGITPISSSAAGTVAIPRPPSRRSVIAAAAITERWSPSTMTRAESVTSIGSIPTASAPAVGLGAGGTIDRWSRGPSPLTLGYGDTIPIAVAFQEVVHASFRGTDETLCQVRIFGDMKMSFPAGILGALLRTTSGFTTSNTNSTSLSVSSGTSMLDTAQPLRNSLSNNNSGVSHHSSQPSAAGAGFSGCGGGPPQLMFSLANLEPESLVPNSLLVSAVDGAPPGTFRVEMTELVGQLRRLHDANPHQSYFNVDLMKYSVCTAGTGAALAPLHLVAYWNCDAAKSDLKVDYMYNDGVGGTAAGVINQATPASSATGTAAVGSVPRWAHRPCNALISVTLPQSSAATVSNVHSKPPCSWNSVARRATWKLPNVKAGSILARFQHTIVSDDSLASTSYAPSSSAEDGNDASGMSIKLCDGARNDSGNRLNFSPATVTTDHSPGEVAATFTIEDACFSDAAFLLAPLCGYRLSLVKRRIISGRYTVVM